MEGQITRWTQEPPPPPQKKRNPIVPRLHCLRGNYETLGMLLAHQYHQYVISSSVCRTYAITLCVCLRHMSRQPSVSGAVWTPERNLSVSTARSLVSASSNAIFLTHRNAGRPLTRPPRCHQQRVSSAGPVSHQYTYLEDWYFSKAQEWFENMTKIS